MKIKFQSGGMITYTPVFPQPLSGTTTTITTSSKKSESEKIDNTIQKEIIGVLKENGIQSDVDIFLAEANEFLNKSKNLSQYSLFGGDDPEYTMSDLIAVMSMANKVKQNKEQWTSATQQLTKEGAWDEVATTTTGGIYIYDERKGLKVISPDEYHENLEEYHGKALTNAQVLGLREQNTQLAFNTNILKDMNGAIGMKTITDQLTDIIAKFGTMSRAEFVKKTGESISQDTWDGMQTLIAEGPEGYYKVTTKSERENVQSAIKYLWDSLGTDGKKRLRAEVAVSGGDPNKNQYDLILQALEHHTDYSVDVDFDKSASEYDPDGDGKGSKTEALSRLAAFAAGKGEAEEVYLVPRASKVGQRGTMVAKAMNFGNMIGFDQNTLPMMSVGALRSNAEYFKAASNQDVTFGGQLLTGIEEHAVLWDGTSQVAQVWLPYKRVNGQITPDFDLIIRYQDFISALDKNPNISDLEKNKLLQKYGLSGKLKENSLELKDTMCFMTFSAYAHDDAINFTDDTIKLTESVSDEEGSRIGQAYEYASQYGTTSPNKSSKQIYDFDDINSWDTDDFRKGNVYIPIKSSFLGTYASMEELVPESIVNNFNTRSTLANGKNIISGQFTE